MISILLVEFMQLSTSGLSGRFRASYWVKSVLGRKGVTVCGEPYRKGKKKMWSILIVLIICIGITVCIVLPPSFGNMKSLRDENGRILEGSISEKINVDINGTSLGMFIVGKDTSKPILLFLGGGPGIPEYFLETQYPSGLENEFVVCYLEYRGTSLSYHPDFFARNAYDRAMNSNTDKNYGEINM